MKIKVTEIEATAEDLRQSKSLSDSFTNIFRNAFAGILPRTCADDEDDDDEPEIKQVNVTTEATILPDSNEPKTVCLSRE